MSLRWFHVVFLLFALACAEVFGVWALRVFWDNGSIPLLVMGIASLFAGLGLAAYAFWFSQKMDRLHLK